MDVFHKEYDAMRDRIFDLLEEQKISQRDFAQMIQVSPQTITDWKKGKSHSFSNKVSVIARVLHTTPGFLSFGKGLKYMTDERRNELEEQAAERLQETMNELERLRCERESTIDEFRKMMIRNGFSPSDLPRELVSQLAIELKTTTEYLLTGEGPKFIQPLYPESGLPKDAVPIDLNTFHTIPILGRISAGLPLYAEQHVEGYTVTDLNGGAEYFALRVHGDSMDALGIRDGYTIIVRRQDEVENGQVSVIMVGEEDATVKRFYANGSTVTLMPQSTNPEHQPQIYDTAKTRIKVIGRVVEVKFTL